MAPNDPVRPPLSDEERRILTDPAYFAEVAAKGPVVLSDRTVENLEIRDQRFAGVEWRGVDFITTSFASIAFSAAELEHSTFTDCRLEQVSFDRCRLAGLTLRDVRCDACDWRGTSFDHPRLEDVRFDGGSLTGVTLSDANARGFLVRGALIDGLDLVLGSWVALTFEQIHGRSLRLTDVAATAVSLLGCGELVGVAIAGGSVAGLAIDRCPTLGLVGLGHTSIHGLSITDSFLDGAFWQQTTITDGSSIERAVLAGLNLGRSKLDGLAIRDTEFTVALGLEQTRIEGLVLEGIRYAPGLQIRDEGVSYGAGARWPAGAR